MLQGKVPSETVARRQQYLNSMRRFVEEQEKKLSNVLEKLGWSDEDLLKVPVKKVCPYNEGHIVPEASFEKHVEKCRLLQAGYQKDELELLLQDSDFWYKDFDSIMKVNIDESRLNKIIWDHCVQTGQVYTGHRKMPNSHIEANINLTQEDRLAVYRHVVNTSHEAGKIIPMDRSDELLTTDWGSLVKKGLLSEESNKEFSSKLEQLAALRDMKRRRQSYRAKNVHITKKSYTEIIREVIVNQMEVLRPAAEDVKPDLSDLPGSVTQNRSSMTNRSRSRDRERYDKNDRDRYRTRDKQSDHRDQERRSARSPDVYRRSRSPRSVSKTNFERPYYESSRDRFEGRFKDTGSRHESKVFGDSNDMTIGVNIKQEIVSDDSQERDLVDRSEDKGRKKRKKRRHSSSSSDLSTSDVEESGHRKDKSSKHKKSKHKKKHSKKHKRKS